MAETKTAAEWARSVRGGNTEAAILAYAAQETAGLREVAEAVVKAEESDQIGEVQCGSRYLRDAACDALAASPAPPSVVPSSAVNLIAAERQRQITKEGWTLEHDDEHDDGELARAAACYAAPEYTDAGGAPIGWPWDGAWWKPEPDDRVRELVKAGALIIAEIERLQRQPPSASGVHGAGGAR